ncbi:ubiquitin-conjugating enzyme E2 J1 [Rhizoctonia solani]|uniref:Ubiquitin-conjugating enzyme E2 J1 n=1 Tax=Rhizoctonia solani TaxID=456999 RepID=A0A0K6GIC3_9AGAM|nr:ubiquitin-conjugating enzyme E2 J1 [Rhizoctonia solani]
MATRSSHNKNNAAVKRILQEAKELLNDPSHEYSAGPLENDIFEWHATLRGAPDTEFEGGLYHCRILLPAEYPFRPPSIMVLTPNGRFELNKKICISFTNYHEELWQPAWGVRTAIIGLQGFFPHKGEAAVGVGALEYPISERKRLATLSREWYCPDCEQTCLQMLPDPPASSESDPSSENQTDETGSPVEEPGAKAEQATLEPPEIVTTNSSSTESTVRPTNLTPTPTPTTPAQVPTPVEAPRPVPAATPAPSPGSNDATPVPTRTATVRPSTKPPLLLDLVIVSLVSIFIAILARRIL